MLSSRLSELVNPTIQTTLTIEFKAFESVIRQMAPSSTAASASASCTASLEATPMVSRSSAMPSATRIAKKAGTQVTRWSNGARAPSVPIQIATPPR
jgi:hypothetical protein